MKTKEQIIQWYKDNGYYEDFAKEIKRARGMSVNDFLLEGYNPRINYAFSWLGSIKGSDYWKSIDAKLDKWLMSEECTLQSTKEIDWEQRRYETAREIYSRLIFAPKEEHSLTAESDAVSAVELAEILINELKKNKEEL